MVSKNIKYGGLFFMVYKVDRLEEIILEFNKFDFKFKCMRFVYLLFNYEFN